MISTLAVILIVVGVVLLILGALGVTAGISPYGMHGGVTLIVIGIILYVAMALLAGHTVS